MSNLAGSTTFGGGGGQGSGQHKSNTTTTSTNNNVINRGLLKAVEKTLILFGPV